MRKYSAVTGVSSSSLGDVWGTGKLSHGSFVFTLLRLQNVGIFLCLGSCTRKGWAQWVSVLWIMEPVQTRSALPFPPKVTFNSLFFGVQSPCRVFLDAQESDVCPENICFHRARVIWVGRTLGDQSVEFPHHEQGLLSLGQVVPSPVGPDGFSL